MYIKSVYFIPKYLVHFETVHVMRKLTFHMFDTSLEYTSTKSDIAVGFWIRENLENVTKQHPW